MNIKNLLNGNGRTKKTGATKTTKAQHKLEAWAKEQAEMDAATEALRTKAVEIQTQIDAATEKLRAKAADTQTQIDAISAPYLVRIGKLKDQITRLVGEVGTTVTAEGAKAQYRKAYDRTSWNTGKLEVLAVKTPEIRLCISKVSHIKANVSIKLT